MTSPVKQGLEQRGSWGLKCRFLADRRLCWISTVHAPNGNLCLSLASRPGVCFPSERLPCSSEARRDFFSVSAAFLPLSEPHRCQQESGKIWREPGGAWQREPNPNPHLNPNPNPNPNPKPNPAPVGPVGQLCLAFGAMGEEGALTFPALCLGRSHRARRNWPLLFAFVQRSPSRSTKHQKVLLTKRNPFPAAATGPDGKLILVGMGKWDPWRSRK